MTTAAEAVAAAKAAQQGKAMVAPGGWIFLANDTNDFLSWQFGVRRWTAQERARVEAILAERIARLSPTPYLMLVTPEKSVVCQDRLPHSLDRHPSFPDRPAAAIAQMQPKRVRYLEDALRSASAFGPVYFRGDTHVNWLGAYFVYRQAVAALLEAGLAVGEPIPYSRLRLQIGGMEGDLFAQIDPDQRAAFEAEAGVVMHSGMLEAAIRLSLKEPLPTAQDLAERTPLLTRLTGGRELIVKSQPDATLPRAVIFRDSTATLLVDFLAEHFSRAVFIWREGDVIEDVIADERPDVVLHFTAERFLATYPETVPLSRLSDLEHNDPASERT